MRGQTMRRSGLLSLTVATVILATPLAGARPAAADTNQINGSASGPVTAGADYDLWRSNTRQAFDSQGSVCPWLYVGAYYDPSNPNAGVRDTTDPYSKRAVRLFVDCAGEPRGILEPTAQEMAVFAWERVRTKIPDPTVRMQLVDNQVALANTDTPYWLDIGREPINITTSLGGVSTTITVKPALITTNWGDGNTTICEKPTTASPATACNYRFGEKADKTYTVTHDITWKATWKTLGGQSGSFDPVTKQAVSRVNVIQLKSNATRSA
jgi:hypothetical protein